MSMTPEEQLAFAKLQAAAEHWSNVAGQRHGLIAGKVYLQNGMVLEVHSPQDIEAEVDMGEAILTNFAADPAFVEFTFILPSDRISRRAHTMVVDAILDKPDRTNFSLKLGRILR